MTSDSAVLWTRTPDPQTVIPELSLTRAFDHTLVLPALKSSDASDYTVKVVATGLQPGTTYFYRFRSGSEVSPIGSFKTAYASDQNEAVRMAFTGDADWRWKPYPILTDLAKESLDYFLFVGDVIYESTDLAGNSPVEDLRGYRFKYRENREPRGNSVSRMVPMRDLYATFGQYSVFDNHETGLSKDPKAPPFTQGGAQVEGGFVNQTDGFKIRMQAYREYQPVRDELHTGTGDGRTDQTWKFYRAISWGANVEMIVLDDRSYRDAQVQDSADPAAASCARTMLGPVQLNWFQAALLAAQQRRAVWKVVVISSPIQEFGRASQVGVDMEGKKSWAGAYRCERNKLLKFIDDRGIDNVVFLTTDNHFTAVNNLTYNTVADDPQSPRAPVRNALEILTGPIGAGTGIPLYGRHIDIKGLSQREADRKILAVWNGDAPDGNGRLTGLKQAGLDPIGLEANFPGLQVASIRSAGGNPGVAEPLAFGSFRSYSYAVLTFNQSHLHVEVKTMGNVPDPKTLLKADAEMEYESRRVDETFSFTVKAR